MGRHKLLGRCQQGSEPILRSTVRGTPRTNNQNSFTQKGKRQGSQWGQLMALKQSGSRSEKLCFYPAEDNLGDIPVPKVSFVGGRAELFSGTGVPG